MRIGIEAQRIFRKKKAGMDIVVLNLILELQKMNLSHQFFVFVKKDEDNSCLPSCQNFTIVYVKGNNYAYWEQIALPKAIKKYELDVIHFTSDTAPIFLNNVKKILTLHDIMFLERDFLTSIKGSWYQVFGNFYRKWIVPIILKSMNQVITVSDYEKEVILKRFPFVQHKIQRIYNGVSSKKEENDFIDIDVPSHYFFHLGNTEPRKNTKGVLKAFIDYKQKGGLYHLVINGITQEEVIKILDNQLIIDFLPHIILIDYVPMSQLNFLYKNAQALLFPSFREGFGLPPLEAMIYQTPVIASNQSSVPEVCQDAAYYVNPYRIEELTEALFFFEAEEKKQFYIQKGNELVQHYSWTKMAKEVVTIYESLN